MDSRRIIASISVLLRVIPRVIITASVVRSMSTGTVHHSHHVSSFGAASNLTASLTTNTHETKRKIAVLGGIQ